MMLDHFPLARRAQHTAPSAVREILKVTERPDIISFAGGLPAPETFPVEAIARAYADVLAREGGVALQYGTTEGHKPLRAFIAERMSARGRRVEVEDVVMTSGSQQGLDLVSRVLLDPGDTVVVESPSYLAALQVFTTAEARVVPVATDAEGVRTDALAEVLAREKPKLLYLVPDFQNPSGTRLALERRAEVRRLAAQHRVAILEDDPYGELSFDGPRWAPLSAHDDEGVVIYLSTFSKTLSPGLRLGWVSAPRELLRAITVAKQAADLHTATLAQRAVARLLEDFDYEAHLRMIRDLYGRRAQAMQAAMTRHMPAGVRWNTPAGGLFLWAALPAEVDVSRTFQRALEAKVAFVPGDPFFAGPPPGPHMRLNFSHRDEATIAVGIERLGAAIAEATRVGPGVVEGPRDTRAGAQAGG
jgi:2-aminoadipate transaminase